jgi:hypothetical protein
MLTSSSVNMVRTAVIRVCVGFTNLVALEAITESLQHELLPQWNIKVRGLTRVDTD